MNTPQHQNRLCNRVIAGLASAVIHAAVLVLCVLAAGRTMADLSDSADISKSPVIPLVAPAPGPVQPDPPQPAEPEPVVQPPQPEPPQPAEPEPVVQPPRPDVKPAPTVEPKPEPPRKKTMAERLAEAKRVKAPKTEAPRSKSSRTSTDYSTKNLENALKSSGSTSQPSSGSSSGKSRSSSAQQSADYANRVVKPRLDELWVQPKLGGKRVRAVQLEFIVEASGRIISSRIKEKSDNEQMNRSAEELLKRLTHFAPFSSVGVTEPSLRIFVSLALKSE